MNRLALKRILDDTLLPLIPAGSTVAVFDFPNYANVGDSAIWLGQQAFFKHHGMQLIHVDDGSPRAEDLPRLPGGTVILITGGGNFGDIYPKHQALRERLIKAYTDNRIVQLPQSIYFGDPEKERSFARILQQHPDFHLVVRDEASLQCARRINPGSNYLCPDMALYLDQLPAGKPAVWPVVALLREDKEKRFATEAVEGGIVTSDWTEESPIIKWSVKFLTKFRRKISPGRPSDGFRIRLYDAAARQRLKRGCRYLLSGKVVITDRLHGHILATMLGTPNVVLDNSYGKIASFRAQWHTGDDDGLCETAASYPAAVAAATTRASRG